MHISEMLCLVRDNHHILEVLHRDQLTLRIHDCAFYAMDLTARHPRTGELLSTVKFMGRSSRSRRAPPDRGAGARPARLGDST
ncbi:hypothetical protein [Streptomyces californicus]|uniref:hypothetical protein n=1 Tax=Streptomyces californicus TaxID=67351 RepID=UPI00296E735D|nr:hypothetical protein [Streptomyces californicus]MDW4918327.1 hypothetical protein [Streptomyces californicus]